MADPFTILEDRHFYTSVDELLKNDADGASFIGLGGASHGQVSIDANNDIFYPKSPIWVKNGLQNSGKLLVEI